MTRIFFSAEQPLLGEGLRTVLERCPHCDLRWAEPQEEAWRELLEQWKPDVAVLEWAGHLTWNPLACLREMAPDCRALLLLRDGSPEMMFQAREAGAAGALGIQTTPQQLLDAVGRILAGEFVFDQAAFDWPRGARRIRLTRRESELVGLLVQGLKNKEIATALGLTEGTVKVYLSKLFQKVGAKDRFELALFGVRNLSFNNGNGAMAKRGEQQGRLRSLVVHGEGESRARLSA